MTPTTTTARSRKALQTALQPPREPSAEARVIRQLVEALLFEKLVEHTTRPRSSAGAWASAFEAIYDLQIDFELGHRGVRCLAAIKSFDRVRVAEGSAHWLERGEARACELDELVAALPIDAASRRRLSDELTQTVALCRWNRENLAHAHTPRRDLGFQQLESAIVEGHPYHPCFKARTGFSLQDHADFGAEAGNAFQLQWLAVARGALKSALPDDEATFWQRELGEHAYAVLTQRLAQRGGDWNGYGLLPAHPWQLGSLALEAPLATREIVPLGFAGDRYHASQSLRTLVNATNAHKANVKLPLDVVCTSVRRNLREHFVCTAPALSEWLSCLVAEDPYFQARPVLVLKEYAALLYTRGRGKLGAIFRESVCDKLEAGEAAVPFTALMLLESDGRPFIADWLAEHGVAAWIDRLIEVVLLPLWHLLVHHGVAFEAHAQNLVLLHRRGWPTRLALRDFHEDTEVVPDYLRAPEQLPAFEQLDPYFATVPDDDGYRMASTEALRELFMDTVYVYNLADLAFLLERCFGWGEGAFWSAVRAQLRAYARSGVTEQARIDRIGSERAEIIVESLLTKKIKDGDTLDFFEHSVRNTLHG